MMRRMKIRPKPNLGVSGGASRSTPAKPASQESAASRNIQENPSLPNKEGTATQLLISNSDKPTEGSVETSSRNEIQDKDIDARLQGESNQSNESAASPPPPPNLTAVCKNEPVETACISVEHQETLQGLKCTVPPATDNMNPLLAEVNASPVPSQAQKSPQERPDSPMTQTDSQSVNHATEVAAKRIMDIVPAVVQMPLSDQSSKASEETQQDMEAKATLCGRRKRVKVRPMLGGIRKSGMMDKPRIKAPEQSISEAAVSKENNEKNLDSNTMKSVDVNIEFVSEKTISQASNQDPDVPQIKHVRFKEKADPDISNVSKDSLNNFPVKPLNLDKEARTPELSEPSKVSPALEEAPQVKDTNPETLTPASMVSKVELVDKTDTLMVVEKPGPVGEIKPSHTSLDSSTPVVGNKRRARIRAMPTIVSKKKKEEGRVIAAKPMNKITEVQCLEEASPHKNVSKRSDCEVPSTGLAELNAESSKDYQVKQSQVNSTDDAPKNEVSFARREGADMNLNNLVNMTESKKEKEQHQAKRLKKEGFDVICKENAEIPLQSNIRPCRKKKLSENSETDPDLEVVNVVNSSIEKQGRKRLQKENSEEIGNSDDSTGDKENASSAITEVSSEEKAARESKPLIPQKAKVKSAPSAYSSEKLFGKLERKIKIEDSTEKAAKQVFRKRKDEFRKKLSKGDLEPGKMTMFDLIYWNPASNPMPGRTSSPKRNSRTSGRSDTDSIASEAAEEQQVDDLGLDPDSEHQSCPESPEVVETKKNQEKSSEESRDDAGEEKDPEEEDACNGEDSSEAKDVFAPRVKIGPNGEIMVDKQSIKRQTTAAKNRDEVLKKAVVVEESGDSSHYGKWSKRRRKSLEWTVKETALFYKALSTVGTDFSLMETLIKWRTRAELKTKFKKEERSNRDLVDLALNDSTQFDMTVFEEESGYDPNEDRKAARQAERAEAKRRRLEMKQQDKLKQMEIKKLENKKKKVENMNRKKMLRKAYKSRAKKRKEIMESDNEDSPILDDSENNVSEDSAPEEPDPCVTVKVKRSPRMKRQQPKRRNSLVISEVTVTMETVKYDKPEEQNIIPEQTIEEPEAPPSCDPPSIEAAGFATGDDNRPHEDNQQWRSPEYIIPERYDEVASGENHDGQDEIILFSGYSELPENEGLPESYIIESMLSDDEANSNVSHLDDLEDNVPSKDVAEPAKEVNNVPTKDVAKPAEEVRGIGSDGEATAVLEPYAPAVEPVCVDDNQKMWHFPISSIQTLENGQQVIPVPTPNGHYSVPVPALPPGASNVVVVAMDLPDSPGEHIYHVYIVSPLEATDS